MKKILIMCVLAAFVSAGAAAQAKSRKGATKQTAASGAAKKEGVTLENTSAQAAYAPAGQLRISDPVLNFYDGRSSGAIPDEAIRRPVLGMPKLRYGVGNGHLLFYSTSAPTTGSSTGSGSVGTGTSAGNVGTAGSAIGVNGKNPYSGPGIYGNRVRLSGQPINLPPAASGKSDQKP